MTTGTVAESLGGARVLGTDVDSPLEWVEVLESGLPIGALDRAIEHRLLSREEADQYVIPRRTLSHRRQRGDRLTLEESDRLSRIARITARATETFGAADQASLWLREPNGGLGGARPLDLLKSGEGAILVDQILTRIDHGVFT